MNSSRKVVTRIKYVMVLCFPFYFFNRHRLHILGRVINNGFLSCLQVTYSVGAMSKGMFDRLFKYLVKKCNETLDTQQKRQHFIGVLDIAGFEIFDVSIDQYGTFLNDRRRALRKRFTIYFQKSQVFV